METPQPVGSLRVLKVATLAMAASSLFLVFWPAAEIPARGTLIDDAYYSLTIARNLALGNGLSADGRSLTNGFQPLYVFLVAPLYATMSGDRVESLRAVLALNWLILMITALLLASLPSQQPTEVERRTCSWLTAFLYLSNYQVFTMHFNGLETGLLLCAVALVWRLVSSAPQVPSLRAATGLGAVLGGAVLVRIDAVFLVAALVMAFSWRHGGVSARRWSIAAPVAVLVSMPWWLYNVFFFGSLMPTSGTAQQSWTLSVERWKQLGHAILTNLVPITPFPAAAQFRGVTVLRIACLVAIILVAGTVAASRKGLSAWPVRPSRTQLTALVIVAAYLTLGCWYSLSSFAVWHYKRYLAPLLLVSLTAIAASIARYAARHSRFSFLLVVALGTTVPARAVFRYEVPGSGTANYWEQVRLVERYVSPADWVAASQSGTLSYYRDKVVNLDGKVNAEVLPHRPWASDNTVAAYLRSRGIDYFCDWPVFAASIVGRQQGWSVLARSEEFVLYTRRGGAEAGGLK